MRDATPEELKSVNDYIESISSDSRVFCTSEGITNLKKSLLEQTRHMMQYNGFTCRNCKWSKVWKHEDAEYDSYECTRACWGPDYLKHRLAYCSDFEFKNNLKFQDGISDDEGYLSKEDEERYAKAVHKLYKPTDINAFEEK